MSLDRTGFFPSIASQSAMSTQTNIAQVDSIQALRGISALLVVGYHWQAMLNHVYVQPDLGHILFLSGFMGVDIFFVISGFVIALVTRERSAQRPLPFFLQRVVRIAPLAWLALLSWYWLRGGTLAAAFSNAPILWYGFAFILPGGDAPQFGRGLLDVVWTLTYEFVFYAVFAVCMRLSGRYRVPIATLTLLTMSLGLQYLIAGHWTLDPSAAPVYSGAFWPPTLISVASNPLMLEFIPGMWLAQLYLRLPQRDWIWARYVGALSVILFICIYLNHPPIPNRVLMCGPWAVLLVAGLLVWERLGNLRVTPWLVDLGVLSYAIYLFHYPLEAFVNTVWPMKLFFPSFLGIQKFMLYSTCLLVVCTVLHWTIEKPCMRFGKFLTRRLWQHNRSASRSPDAALERHGAAQRYQST